MPHCTSGAALHKPAEALTIKSHAAYFEVSYQTARNDLRELAARGLLRQFKRGRTACFVITDEAREQLE